MRKHHPRNERIKRQFPVCTAAGYTITGPKFIVRIEGAPQRSLVLETKGHDPLKDVKWQAAERWVAAVNADGRVGQ